MGLLPIQFYSVRQSKTNILYFLIHFLFKLTKILFICPWVMFKVAFIFVLIRLIFEVILLTWKQQMLDIYMHACSTVELLT
jgi:hypothetical protein